MSDTCPTVKIKTEAADNESGFIIINESDFDEAVHELFDPVDSNGDKVPTKVGEMRDALTALGIAFDPKAKKPELQALLDKGAAAPAPAPAPVAAPAPAPAPTPSAPPAAA